MRTRIFLYFAKSLSSRSWQSFIYSKMSHLIFFSKHSSILKLCGFVAMNGGDKMEVSFYSIVLSASLSRGEACLLIVCIRCHYRLKVETRRGPALVPVVTALPALHHALSFIHFPVQLGPQPSVSLFEPAFIEGRACVISILAPETCRQVCLPQTQQKTKELMNSVTSVSWGKQWFLFYLFIRSPLHTTQRNTNCSFDCQ